MPNKRPPNFDLTRYTVTVRDEDGIALRRIAVYAKSKAAACSIVMDKARVRKTRAEVASTRGGRVA